jgi:RNA polymerase sigma factor (sigma-70 family)
MGGAFMKTFSQRSRAGSARKSRTPPGRPVRAARISPRRESELGAAIREAEEAVHEAVRDVQVCEEALGKRFTGSWKTRADRVVRLAAAVQALDEAASDDPGLRENAEQAKAAWERAEGLTWELALSALHIVGPEAAKVARASRVDESDLVTEGTIGLHDAALRFDPDLGIRFATYAKWWARARMTRAVDRGGREIRMSGIAVEQRRRLRQVEQELARSGVSPTLAEVAAGAGVSELRARELLQTGEVVSLDTPVDDGPKTRRLEEMLASVGTDPEERTVANQEVDWLRVALDELPDQRQRYVLRRRYGLDDGEPRTLAQVGEELGVSRERVRQIESEALRDLRSRPEFAQ